LFFDPVYVFAITQLSHLILDDLSVGGVARAAFLLLIVGWAWIYTTWMANWFDPASSSAVRAVLTRVMLASLLMAAALPRCLRRARRPVRDQLRRPAGQSQRRGREPAGSRPATARRLRALVGWSAASGVLWLAGAALPGDRRLLLWIPAVVLDLCAPVAGYWLPRGGRAVTSDYDIEGGHFTDRCQGFIIVALGVRLAAQPAPTTHTL
jgi:low temperature requirement protein LtrA